MFQFLRRASVSLFPRPDRPWRDDATSHAPTIGRKRTYSVIEQDDDDSVSTAKKTKNEPVQPGAEYDSASEGEGTKEDAASLVEGQEVKEVTEGVKEVDLGSKDEVKDASSIQPEGIPLPDSPSGSPEPDLESPEPAKSDAAQETKDQEHVVDTDSSVLEDDVDEEEPITTNTGASAEITLAGSGLQDIPEALEVKA